jgi:tetratricopeptide (TPR) repeat protein
MHPPTKPTTTWCAGEAALPSADGGGRSPGEKAPPGGTRSLETPSVAEATPTLSELLLRWEALRAEGQDLVAEELCRDCPEQASAIARRLDALRAVYRVLDTDTAAQANAEAATLAPGQAAAPASASPAVRVPGYEILDELGRGGMGVVYKARQAALDRLVALKMVLSGSHAGAEELIRFRREAEAVARLQHPHIVQIHEVSEFDGKPYFSLEFVEGGSLDKQLNGTPLHPSKAAGLVETLAGAVDYAHRQGVVHRDLKPANILLQMQNAECRMQNEKPNSAFCILHSAFPKVTDFGLAKLMTRDQGQTQSGAILGTPSYMAPEQAGGQGKEVGPAADVYALGAMLYELLSGRPPFKAATPFDTILQVMELEPVPPSRLQPKIPRDLETICLKCLRKEPAKRYAGAADLAEDLRRFQAGEPIMARPTSLWERTFKWARRRPAVAALYAVILLGLVGLAGVAFLLAKHNRELSAAVVTINAERQRTATERDQKEQALQAEARRRRQTRQALDTLSSGVIEQLLAKQQELLPEHKELLRKALASYEEFARDTGQDEKTRAGVAAASKRVGVIRYRLGRTKDAEAAYRRSQELYRALVAQFPNRREYRRELGTVHNNLGVVLELTGRAKESEATHRAALALRKQLVADFPHRAEYRQELAMSYNNLGMLLMSIGRPQQAEPAFRAAVAIRQHLVARFPKQHEYRRYLASVQLNLGNALSQTSRLPEADATYHAALELQKRLVADFPAAPDYRLELARTYQNVARLLEERDRLQEAEAAYHDALALYKRLAGDFPVRADYRYGLADCNDDLATLLRKTGRPKQAEAAFRESLVIFKQLAADFPARPDYRESLAIEHTNLGALLANTGRAKEGEASLQAGLGIYRQLTAHFPASPHYKHALGESLGSLANLAYAQGRYTDACRWLAEALPQSQAALRVNPRAPAFRAGYHKNLLTLAQAQLKLGAHVAAARAAEDMVRIIHAPKNDSYEAACILAACMSLAEKDARLPEAKRRALAAGYAERAVVLLRQAFAHGYKGAARLKKDKVFDPLRSRPDFQKLVAELPDRSDWK